MCQHTEQTDPPRFRTATLRLVLLLMGLLPWPFFLLTEDCVRSLGIPLIFVVSNISCWGVLLLLLGRLPKIPTYLRIAVSAVGYLAILASLFVLGWWLILPGDIAFHGIGLTGSVLLNPVLQVLGQFVGAKASKEVHCGGGEA